MNARSVRAIFKRELAGYFVTPVAYVFLFFFLVLTGSATFLLAGLYESGQADLVGFFFWHPWLYLFLIPAVTMRLWADERRSGTIELLMTLPVTMGEAVLGKFLAAWAFTGVALALTFPIWITVNYLGDPDNGVILAGYLGSLLMAGAYLAVGAALSAITRNQVIAFVTSIVVLFLFHMLIGLPQVLGFFAGWLPSGLAEVVSGFSFLTHFEAIRRGVLDARNVLFFLSLTVLWLYLNAVIADWRKAK